MPCDNRLDDPLPPPDAQGVARLLEVARDEDPELGLFLRLAVVLGALFVAKMLGPVALAHYSIGVYVQPVITVLRNSISDVLLPEMVGSGRDSQADPLELWRRSTVVTAIEPVTGETWQASRWGVRREVGDEHQAGHLTMLLQSGAAPD